MFVLCDIDGTMANTSKRSQYVRSKPKNWDAFYAGIPHDAVNDDIHDVVEALSIAGHTIVFMSGRDGKYEDWTRRWIMKNVDFKHEEKIFMRKKGDRRPDFKIKLELLDEMMKFYGITKCDILCAIDDRTQVVKAWRSVGITCLQVDEGNF